MRIGIPKESLPGETRVAATPRTVVQLLKLGHEVVVESGAGKAASLEDSAYTAAGATVADAAAVVERGAPVDVLYLDPLAVPHRGPVAEVAGAKEAHAVAQLTSRAALDEAVSATWRQGRQG